MHDFRIGMNDKQGQAVFRMFDRDGSGEVSYEEFLRIIRGEVNKFRRGNAMKAYKIMDSDRSGQLDITISEDTCETACPIPSSVIHRYPKTYPPTAMAVTEK